MKNTAVSNSPSIHTLGELIAAGYTPKSIKQELRDNLLARLKAKAPLFEGIIGYQDTVIPDLERAILSRHNINLLGLRGQAKTRIARLMVNLLDEWIPVVKDSELNDDPLQPLSRHARDLVAEKGNATPIEWMHRSERFAEKLATPDVSVADLIGDVDPIKAANMKLNYSDERVIHYGIIPRANRCIFVINELPDLQARIQVALFNILQEGDIQIRGFKLRLPLDIQFVFTANPEDYTNRGSIVTPLKDRIGSQILTHYPKDIETAKLITQQEARSRQDAAAVIHVPDAALSILEQIGFEARESEFIDAKSGVSARLSISAYENLISAAERRAILNGEAETMVRITDFAAVIPAITGKVEMVYEGEQEGAAGVAQHLIGKAIRTLFPTYFPSPEKLKKKTETSPYQPIIDWFGEGNTLDLTADMPARTYTAALSVVDGLDELVTKHYPAAEGMQKLFLMELVLHGLSEYSRLSRNSLNSGARFGDLMGSMLGGE
ncbi:MAG: magnesium chelatase [Bacteroidia bacterium]|jgi:magnesium chelatase subunit I|nr:magnesium chelatase [Bacteroidia bacterium]